MLKGKNTIVTGGSRGLGRTTAEYFLRNGAGVWLCSRAPAPDFEALEKLAEECGTWVRPVLFDLTDAAATDEAVRGITGEGRRVDVLVNNAARTDATLFLNSRDADIRALFELDFFAQLEMCRLVGRRMVAQKSGCIVNMASAVGLIAEPGRTAYGSAKAALIMATKVMAKELGRFGVRVNALAPGVIENRAGDGAYSERQIDQFVAETALGRMGTPAEIANAVVFLASDAASYITGEVLRVDGGR
jgi:3-oxoacyl-[acyl-carrier protein] reductase